MELQPFSYYFVFTKTLNLSNEIQKLAYLDQYSSIVNTKGCMGHGCLYYTIWEVNCVNYSYFGNRAICLLFFVHKDTKSEQREILLVWLGQYTSINKHQRLQGTRIFILYNMGEKHCVSSSYFWRQGRFSTLLWSPRA